MFPNITPADSPWTNPETDITYIYEDGVWKVVVKAVDYLPTAGGLMVGDIRFDPNAYLTNEDNSSNDISIGFTDIRTEVKGQIRFNKDVVLQPDEANKNWLSFRNSSGTEMLRWRQNGDDVRVKVRGDYVLALAADDLSGTERKHIQIKKEETEIRYLKNPVNPGDATSKGWVEGEINKLSFATYLPLTGGELTGPLVLNNSGNGQVNFKKSGNNDIQYDGNWLVSFQSGPKIKLDGWLDMNNYKITNVATPTSAKDAASKSYVDARAGTTVQVTSGTPSTVVKGSMWFNTNDDTLYIKKS